MEKMQQFKRPLFWVDADAVFEREPKWQDVFSKDLAIRFNKNLDDDHPSKVISGSVYINATPNGAMVLKLWGQECINSFSDPERKEEVWDQIALRDVVKREDLEADIGFLPLEYSAIVGNSCDEKEVGEVVIAHYQASRRFKKIINSE